jgi:hypothetical protein
MIKEVDRVELGLTCAEIRQVLDRVINRRQQEQPDQSVPEAIGRQAT